MNVNPGKLDKRIKIILRTEGILDADGFDTGEVTTVIRSCWAQVSNNSGKEVLDSGRKLSEAKKRFLVRDNGTEITAKMIVQYKGHEYDIQYVNTYSDNKEYLEIWTEWEAAV